MGADQFGRVEGLKYRPFQDVFVEAGLNFGNLLFLDAIRRVVVHENDSGGNISFSPEAAREKHDGLIIPAANWLKKSQDLGGLANLIEKANLPCVVVGLGAQSPTASQLPELTPGTIRFLKVISERCATLSLRGAYTGLVLEANGIKNFEVTGCPSLLWHVTQPTNVSPGKRTIEAVAVNGTRYYNKNMFRTPDRSTRVGLIMMRLAAARDLDYVAQTELPDMEIVQEGRWPGGSSEEFDFLSQSYGEIDRERLLTYLIEHVKYFGDVSDWISHLQTKDFVLGTRLHGIVAGLLGGVPSVLITHDSRTEEMASAAGIPYVSDTAFTNAEAVSFQEIYEQADFDHFNKTQFAYYRRFVDFFHRNDVAHRLVPLQFKAGA